jgi:hypothetical protein
LVNKISVLFIYIWKLEKMELYSSVTVIFTQSYPKVYPPSFKPKFHKFYFKNKLIVQLSGYDLFLNGMPQCMIVLDRFLLNPSKISIHIPLLFKAWLKQHHI